MKTNNKQQTAVEWFWNQLPEILPFTVDTETAVKLEEAYKQAKAMQKQMTIKLYNDYENYLEETFKNQCGGQAVVLSFEEFYEQTYGDDKQ
jgi:hypothetical protein